MEKIEKIEKYAPLVVSILITLFITFESPYSGMSINPARTFASDLVAGKWTAFWLYCVAPTSGMWLGTSLCK
jgi:aquaporin Z